MNERSSFTTQAVSYCPECLKALRDIDWEASCFKPIKASGKDFPPIIAGFVHVMWQGEEYRYMEDSLAGQISRVICHPVRIAIIADNAGSRIYEILPTAYVKEDEEVWEILCWEGDRPENRRRVQRHDSHQINVNPQDLL